MRRLKRPKLNFSAHKRLEQVALSLGILLYVLSDGTVRRRIVHPLALVLLVVVPALLGLTTGGASIVQRVLDKVGFTWLIYIETQPSAAGLI